MSKICFIDMPFGKKEDPKSDQTIDFDQVYQDGIRPAVIKAGLKCIRGDEERSGGIIHKAMFARTAPERLCDCRFDHGKSKCLL